MPFNLFKRGEGKPEPERPEGPSGPATQRIPFEGFTDEWHLVGYMELRGRLSDALNRREPLPIAEVAWAPIDGSVPLKPVPGLRSVDPYDLIVVIAGDTGLAGVDEAHRTALRVHKISYDLALEVSPFRVLGTVLMFPGADPQQLLDRSTELFIPALDAVTFYGDQRIEAATGQVVLVNRYYLRGVEQIDRRTLQAVRPLPGQPLGGISWTDRSR